MKWLLNWRSTLKNYDNISVQTPVQIKPLSELSVDDVIHSKRWITSSTDNSDRGLICTGVWHPSCFFILWVPSWLVMMVMMIAVYFSMKWLTDNAWARSKFRVIGTRRYCICGEPIESFGEPTTPVPFVTLSLLWFCRCRWWTTLARYLESNLPVIRQSPWFYPPRAETRPCTTVNPSTLAKRTSIMKR